jgi:hypothetical protein
VIGAYGFAEVEIDHVKIVDLAAFPGYPARIAMFAHSHGQYTVKSCMVRMKPAPFDVLLEAGIAYKGYASSPATIGAELEFRGNDVATQYGAGILVEDNALAEEPKGVTLTSNTVASPVGISLTRLHGSLALDSNTVEATVTGIALDTVSDALVERNRIDVVGGGQASLHMRDVDHSAMRKNRFAGDCQYAFLIDGASHNNEMEFARGHMSKLAVAEAHLFLGPETHDNAIKARDKGLVIADHGWNNVVGD